MDDATLLTIESRSEQLETPIDKDENLLNRVGILVEELRKQEILVDAVTNAHPWYLRIDNNQPGVHDRRVFRICDEVAATLQIELAGASDSSGA